MDFIAKQKTWWITLGEIKAAGILEEGSKIMTDEELLTYEDFKSWEDACKSHQIEDSKIFDNNFDKIKVDAPVFKKPDFLNPVRPRRS